MKEITAYLGHLRISPRKVRLVADQIRGQSSSKAEAKLKFIPKSAARPLFKLLKSALSSAVQAGLKKEDIFVKSIRVDGGRTLKRYMPRARGRATVIRKRSSHISLTLAEKE